MSKRSTRRKPKPKKTITKRLSKLEKELKKNVEFKFFRDATLLNPDDTLTTAGNVIHLTTIPRSTAVINRDGRSATIKSLSIKGLFLSSAAADQGAIRVLVFWARDVEGSLPQLSEILDNTATYKLLSHRNKNEQKNYVVHYDKTHTFASNITTKFVYRTYKFYKRLNHNISWSDTDTAGTIAGAEEGHWFIAAVGQSASAANNPTLRFEWILHFTDM